MTHFLNQLRKQAAKMPVAYSTLITALAAFGCYTSMYAFRKAFTAGTFEGEALWGIDYKVWLVIAQVFGYMLSKFYGIRFIAELGHRRRGVKIVGLVGIAWGALLAFAVVPAPFNIFFLFVNGLPLGVIWGLVFSYLEGRRTTELLGAVMSVSLVFASGFVKTVARILMENVQVTEYWMPFCTGLLFVVPLLICTALLEVTPPPDARDQALRTVREPMGPAARKAFLLTYLPGLVLTVFAYLLFTIIRDIRDNFEVEIWADIGVSGKYIYAQTDSAIAIAVLVLMGSLIFIRNNLKAFMLIHIMILTGCLLAGVSTWLFQQGMIGGIGWMSIAGLGLYMVYIPYNAIFFERLLATFRHTGNIGFVMYVADAVGYLGSVAVLVIRELGLVHLSWGTFFQQAVLLSSALGGISVAFSLWYFRQKKINTNKRQQQPAWEGGITYSST